MILVFGEKFMQMFGFQLNTNIVYKIVLDAKTV
jgi:hypothetical protein